MNGNFHELKKLEAKKYTKAIEYVRIIVIVM